MPDGFSTDFSELTQLAADLGDVPDNSGPLINKAITVSSLKVKKSWQEPLQGSRTLPSLPYAVTFDISVGQFFGVSVIKSEIGFDKSRGQGALGNISEYGSPTISGRGFGLAALEANQGDFVAGLEIAVEQALKKVGL